MWVPPQEGVQGTGLVLAKGSAVLHFRTCCAIEQRSLVPPSTAGPWAPQYGTY